MKNIALTLSGMLLCASIASAQQLNCGASELMQAAYDSQPEIRKERASGEEWTRQFIADLSMQHAKTAAVDTYRIPVVFHVYGTSQGGKAVSDTLIQSAISALNKDFNGQNADFGQVNTQFMPLRATLNIQFKLARKDPNGQPTSGIEYFPTATGYASFGSHDALIAADAWDNFRYVNVYVMHDIFGNGATNNSGVATYPSYANNTNGISRIVYNGALLGSNNFPNQPEFASVLTHEFGHYLNLIHTFEGGCTAPNDNVADTPPCTSAQGCHANPSSALPLNCSGNLVNADNYMDYNICYKMFTIGQRNRMEAALYFNSLVTLWQDSNLVFTGLKSPSASVNAATEPGLSLRPNPSEGLFYVEHLQGRAGGYSVYDAMGRILFSGTTPLGSDQLTIDLRAWPAGVYFLRLQDDRGPQQLRLERL